MGEMVPILFFGVFVAIAIGAIVLSLVFERRRKEAWRGVAERLGFRYSEGQDLLTRFGDLKTFSQGRSRKVTASLVGEAAGIEVHIADYRYTTGSGKNSTTHQQTLCVLCNQAFDLPHCYLRRQLAFFDFLGRLFGGQDIDFSEDPQFSEAFILQGEHEEAVRRVFGADVRAYFLRLRGSRHGSRLQFEAAREALILNCGVRIKPDEAEEVMGLAFEALQAFQGAAQDEPARRPLT